MDLKTSDPADDLCALLGSRICHDLISPLGAISNGVELLMMADTSPGPELALISQSIESANARIRLFRAAFGAAHSGQTIGRVEVIGILDDMTKGSKLLIDLQGPADLLRTDVKLAFLAILCIETALAFGGHIQISIGSKSVDIEASAERIKFDNGLWARLADQGSGVPLSAAQVQFALLPAEARKLGRKVEVKMTDTRITLRA